MDRREGGKFNGKKRIYRSSVEKDTIYRKPLITGGCRKREKKEKKKPPLSSIKRGGSVVRSSFEEKIFPERRSCRYRGKEIRKRGSTRLKGTKKKKRTAYAISKVLGCIIRGGEGGLFHKGGCPRALLAAGREELSLEHTSPRKKIPKKKKCPSTKNSRHLLSAKRTPLLEHPRRAQGGLQKADVAASRESVPGNLGGTVLQALKMLCVRKKSAFKQFQEKGLG